MLLDGVIDNSEHHENTGSCDNWPLQRPTAVSYLKHRYKADVVRCNTRQICRQKIVQLHKQSEKFASPTSG
ncbi:SCAR-like protein [Trichinella spiralis]|uniref:SCAR-like protein n=1 Tax=Trichinella spiralis TaxID=6334 RepID=A0ABR3KE93_TRISP